MVLVGIICHINVLLSNVQLFYLIHPDLDLFCNSTSVCGTFLFLEFRHVLTSGRYVYDQFNSQLKNLTAGDIIRNSGGTQHEHFLYQHCLYPSLMKLQIKPSPLYDFSSSSSLFVSSSDRISLIVLDCL